MKDNKFVPVAPKTYIVSELKDQEVKKSPLSLAARNKIVNRSGSNYQSPLIENDISEPTSYGPGLVSISGQGSSVVKLIAAGDASSLIGDVAGVKTCAAMHCWASISSSEYYCFSHKNRVGEGATDVAKHFDETAKREGGLVVVSQANSGRENKTTVTYDSNRSTITYENVNRSA